MPAGDAGLERQAERERILTTLRQYGAASGQYVHPWYVSALFDALAYLVENTPMAQIERLRAQLAAQQAVVDAARWVITEARWVEHARCGKSCIWWGLIDSLAVLDAAHAAQPEGEPR